MKLLQDIVEKSFLVGGAVRDHLMDLMPVDLDYVVVGSDPEAMIAAGFRQVGRGFPVFLHPETQDEYALARTERKTGSGNAGFICEWKGVTLEEDLSRRDLTINSMAQDLITGLIYDPFNGQDDIKSKTLRHTTEAFSEDPLRVLRVARFLSRFGGEWTIAHDTSLLMREMVEAGSLEQLPVERVWAEMEKAISSPNPSMFFDVMTECGFFPFIGELSKCDQRRDHHPEGDVLTHTFLSMAYAADEKMLPMTIFACLCHDFGKPIAQDKFGSAHGHEKEGLPFVEAFCDEWRVPLRFKRIAMMTTEYHTKVHGILGRGDNAPTTPKSIMQFFEATSALTKEIDFGMMLDACEADAAGRGDGPEQIAEFAKAPYPQREYLMQCLRAVKSLDTKPLTEKLLLAEKSGKIIGMEVRGARIKAIREVRKMYIYGDKYMKPTPRKLTEHQPKKPCKDILDFSFQSEWTYKSLLSCDMLKESYPFCKGDSFVLDMARYLELVKRGPFQIGMQVFKTSGCKFKSGSKTSHIKSFCMHPITGLPSFILEECGSVVEERKCKESKDV